MIIYVAVCSNVLYISNYFADRRVQIFLAYLRQPSVISSNISITPKLHILEDHVVPWMREWQQGLGVMGEQGAESIHAQFNVLRRTYNNIKSNTERLKHMLKEHHLQVSPFTQEHRPIKNTRK